MEYRDGDGKMTVMPPGSASVPAEHGFDWVDPSWGARRRGRAVARTIEGLTGGLQIAAKYNQAAKAYEESRQALVHARDQASLLPMKLEAERARLHGEMLQGQAQLSRALQEVQQASQLSAAEHEITMEMLEERRLRAKAKRKAAKRTLKNRREPEPAPTPEPEGEGPEAFQRHFKTMQEAKKNITEGERRIQAIYARAAAERRQLSEEEILEVDAISDAADAAADEIRRGGASDF